MRVESSAGPVAAPERITNLDTVRGVAVLGILIMNVVSFGLPEAAYFNLDAGGSDSVLDRVVGIGGEIVVDQKTMALFSALFGAGIVLFADRTAAKGGRSVLLSLWRNLLLGLLGLAHMVLWEGDVLLLYAMCAPLLVATRRLHPKLLFAMGTTCVVGSALMVALVQGSVGASGDELGSYWFADGGQIADGPGLAVLGDFVLRALGMMWIGVALYRLDVLQGRRSSGFYRSMAIVGLAIGLPMSIIGVVVQAATDYTPDVALIGQAPNHLATIPLAIAYIGLITLWDRRPESELHRRIRACGRMALTNYLTQSIIGIALLRGVLSRGELGRTALLGFVVAVWIVQLAWSKPWLERFRFGPFEWLWRCLTYRRWQPLRR